MAREMEPVLPCRRGRGWGRLPHSLRLSNRHGAGCHPTPGLFFGLLMDPPPPQPHRSPAHTTTTGAGLLMADTRSTARHPTSTSCARPGTPPGMGRAHAARHGRGPPSPTAAAGACAGEVREGGVGAVQEAQLHVLVRLHVRHEQRPDPLPLRPPTRACGAAPSSACFAPLPSSCRVSP